MFDWPRDIDCECHSCIHGNCRRSEMLSRSSGEPYRCLLVGGLRAPQECRSQQIRRPKAPYEAHEPYLMLVDYIPVASIVKINFLLGILGKEASVKTRSWDLLKLATALVQSLKHQRISEGAQICCSCTVLLTEVGNCLRVEVVSKSKASHQCKRGTTFVVPLLAESADTRSV